MPCHKIYILCDFALSAIRQIPEKLEFENKNEFKANCKSPGENGVEQSILLTLGIKTGSDSKPGGTEMHSIEGNANA